MNLGWHSNVGSYRLRDLKNGQYQIHQQNGQAFEGTWELIDLMAQEMGVDPLSLVIARKELTDNNDDYAEFGIYGTFLFTRRNEEHRGVA
jgi:hypothetical protein